MATLCDGNALDLGQESFNFSVDLIGLALNDFGRGRLHH
jgi:hypothetical protein